MLNEQQRIQLAKPIQANRVGKDGKGFNHIEAWDARRVMIGIFGFAEWSADITTMELVFETEGTGKTGNPAWTVCYRAQCVVHVNGNTYTEWAAGDAQNYPSRADAHDQAMKTAESQAFKRCLVNLGDQFGLSLYSGIKGHPQSVRGTLDHWTPPAEDTDDKDTDSE